MFPIRATVQAVDSRTFWGQLCGRPSCPVIEIDYGWFWNRTRHPTMLGAMGKILGDVRSHRFPQGARLEIVTNNLPWSDRNLADITLTYLYGHGVQVSLQHVNPSDGTIVYGLVP